ncbi:hypothetical protein PROAA_460024 [Candidatus Propionivibrio aalborgensis]|uniref:Uncharacterized protein n=1 Tax=Candidatus Propionivibrio aalborgensis TaxID=1860101 RepID=A0A1A8XZQ2_9RHOO|nr:hypothetical protein PROAA_460024 [Candidatus Propionivibrio aalborgensis]
MSGMYSQCVKAKIDTSGLMPTAWVRRTCPESGIYHVLDAEVERYFMAMGGGERILESWFDPRCRIAPGGRADQRDGGFVKTCALTFTAHQARRFIR